MEQPPSILACLVTSRKWRLAAALGLGQVVSLLVTATGFTSSYLARQGFNAPTAQSTCNYVLLAFTCGFFTLLKRQKVQTPWYVFLFLAIVDLEANYLVVKAYQYTSITSVMLLDCWTIPCVMLLTRLLLKTRYLLGHFVGVGLCVFGLVLVVLSDVHSKDRSGGSNVLVGDLLVIAGSTLYAVSNVTEEYLLRKMNPVQLLGRLGLFGSILGGIQVAVLERHSLQEMHWTMDSIGPFVGFALALFAFYLLVPVLLQSSGSAMFNLSLLTSDMWAVAIRAIAYHEVVDWLYFVAFAMVTMGLILYSYFGEPISRRQLARRAEEGHEEVEIVHHVAGDDSVRKQNEAAAATAPAAVDKGFQHEGLLQIRG